MYLYHTFVFIFLSSPCSLFPVPCSLTNLKQPDTYSNFNVLVPHFCFYIPFFSLFPVPCSLVIRTIFNANLLNHS
ncbi:MAG: hypothetical protein ACK57T_08855 [Dolichospermum sp.]